MPRDTKIGWCDHSWNPMVGCRKVSPGCTHCYAEAVTKRFGVSAFPHGFEPTFLPNRLSEPGSWRKPSRIFVDSMSDLFHPAFTTNQRDLVFDAMMASSRHDYIVLTKRSGLMRSYLTGSRITEIRMDGSHIGWLERRRLDVLPDHIWIGTSIESDKYCVRADYLRDIPAKIRFLSLEPLLGPLPNLDLDGISWVIVGGESGPQHRPMDDAWARDIRDQCQDKGIAFFFKQHSGPRPGMNATLDGKTWNEYPLPHPHSMSRLVAQLQAKYW